MNQLQFNDICETTARALHVEPLQQDRRYSLSIDEVEVLMDFEDAEDSNALFFYIDLGDTDSHERAEVCEQLLQLNLRTHGTLRGAYAFDGGSSRAIFCGELRDGEALDGDFVAEMLRYHIDETKTAREVIGLRSSEGPGVLLASVLA
ncbi:Tir chaperone protein (CesT) [Variovorax sp. PBS-H4]|uniref:CesT family type III secretion system chaperone n=1 Tax=Variovorax sp. PBS-H4 TaxID=434008 RepID=UPI0013179D68|nr:CesT family type III secretion system chaperone [Variovorax sp. PBS-H4]VTU18867.1 Tir chaperone protein (CesT) [Variovorax sp. PBS-H4]